MKKIFIAIYGVIIICSLNFSVERNQAFTPKIQLSSLPITVTFDDFRFCEILSYLSR
jgi:hypothetical protein